MTFPESEMILQLLNKGAWRIGKKVQKGLVKVRVYVSRNYEGTFFEPFERVSLRHQFRELLYEGVAKRFSEITADTDKFSAIYFRGNILVFLELTLIKVKG